MSVETLGVDLRMRTKKLGAKEKARRKKCDDRFSPIKKNRFQKNYMRIGVRKLLRTGLVPARVWRGQAVGIAPTVSLKLRRQLAAAAGKKESVSLSLFMEVHSLEVEEELFTMATVAWAEGVWMGRWKKQLKAWTKQIFGVQTWRGMAKINSKRARLDRVLCECSFGEVCVVVSSGSDCEFVEPQTFSPPENAKRVWLWSVRQTWILKDRPQSCARICQEKTFAAKFAFSSSARMYAKQSAACTRRDAFATNGDVA